MLRWATVVCAVWIVSVVIFRFIAPPITPLMIIRAIEYWSHGKSRIKGWEWKPLSYYPLHAQQAVVAAEDARFIEHWGVDLSAVEDAIDDSDERSKPRGASTITMQTVKNVFLWPGRSYLRKVIEAGMAPIAGLVWGKRRTLELYLNIIEWGEGIYGLEAASRYYYNKPAHQLDIREAAALASILPAPRKLSPKSLSSASQKRYQRILREAQAIVLPEQGSARASYRWKRNK
jgi:monofunctional biosynthetic peptidoglycan transglycosylase